jgi:glucokinase
MSCPVLLGDVGGTNARLALLTDGGLGTVTRYEVADHPDPLALFSDFIARKAGNARPLQAVFAVAGPIADDGRSVQVTNSPWLLSAGAIESALNLARVRLVNDFAAIAWSLTRLADGDMLQIGRGTPIAGAPRTVLGPGTGLGVAHLLTVDGRPVVLPTEGGHATMPAADAGEAAILSVIRARYGHVSGERVLSGDGLINLHEAVTTLAGHHPHADSPETVTAHAVDGCADCRRTIEVFLSMLGSFAGNLALTVDARGGVFIAGGIVPRLADHLAGSPFRARFESKGRHSERMRMMPSYLIRKPDVAFDGLLALAGQ